MEITLHQVGYLQDPDRTLIERMAARDEDALRALYAAHGRRLYAYAFRIVGDRLVAEEVVQDSLLAAWKGAGTFRGDGRVTTWLLSIVHRQALNATRRKQLPRAEEQAAMECPDTAPLPDDLAVTGDRRAVLSARLNQLSMEHRTVLELVFFQGLRLEEVARVCDCPLGTVKSRLNYAKTRLRESLQQAGLGAEELL